MFDNLRNRANWESIIANPLTPPYLKSVIRNILIPYGINAKRFQINQYCIDNCCESTPNGETASKSVIETVRDLNYKFSCIRCSSMPLWYYYAFPDVFLWTISESQSLKNFFKAFEARHNGQDLLDSRGEVDEKFVKEFIDAYLNSTNKELECKR